MNYGPGPTDIYSAYQQQQAQPQITPWVAQRMQNGQPPQGDPMAGPMGAQQPVPGGQPRQGAGVQGADPQMLRDIVALNMQGADAQDAQRHKALADRLRADAKGQLAGRDTGKFYVGPSWVNMAANVMENRAANKAESEQAKSDRKSAEDAEKVSNRIVEALARRNRETY